MNKMVLIIGAGGVAKVAAHKCAQNNDILGNICIASRSENKIKNIIESIYNKNNIKDSSKIIISKKLIIDPNDNSNILQLIDEIKPNIVINLASPFCNMSIMKACLEKKVAYIDTAVHEDPYTKNMPYPWYANFEWKKKDEFKKNQVTAILGAGFDPGVVNAYCAYAQKHYFDKINTIDIMDVNAGNHGHFFATNFNAETNLHEISEDVGYFEDNTWKQCSHLSKSRTYDFPEIGKYKVYLMGHDEIHSLPSFINAKSIRFWMGFSDHYINCFNVLKNCGLLNHNLVDLDTGQKVVPLKVLKACLPDPDSLAHNYEGLTCIGNLINGQKNGKPAELFIYNICDHKKCYEEVESQAISYTAGVPPVAAAILYLKGIWKSDSMVNVEELDPDPFIQLLAKMGLETKVKD